MAVKTSSKKSLAAEPQVDEVPNTINLYCPMLKCRGTVNVLKCIFTCPKGRAIKCVEYTKVYPQLEGFVVEEKYILKYGEARVPVPLAYRKRRKRRVNTTFQATQ